jgi:O-antigen chain-terminating methyltransferase
MSEVDRDKAKLEELSEIVRTVREKVRDRYPNATNSGGGDSFRVSLADLMPLVEARDAAQAKIAAIGSVNPRKGGFVNNLIQSLKKTVARSLQWFVRDQVVFNSEVVAAMEATIEALNEQNRALASLAGLGNGLAQDVGITRDMHRNSVEARKEIEHRLATNEVRFMRSVADIQGAFQHRATQMESNFREIVKGQHQDYLGALDRTTAEIHKQLFRDFEKVRGEYGKMIHDELRIIRMRAPQTSAPAPLPQTSANEMDVPSLDYTRFAYQFRGSEEDIRRNQEFYKPYFAGRHDVLDIGCGRGEFLETMRDLGVNARGIDLGIESINYCKGKGLNAEEADLFVYLANQPEGAFDGIFSSQVVEHLAPTKLPEMIRLCASRLRRGGILAIETPNPDCLAIFATYFYLDPTHTRPVPHRLLEFYMEEAGMGEIEVRPLAQAVDSMPELAELPQSFRERFFGGLDYAIIARKL